jgi:Ca-activated chloride channel homolog
MKRALRIVIAAALAALGTPRILPGEAGVIVPSTLQEPDAKVLSIAEMRIDIRIDNGTARVQIRQIHSNHTEGRLEGTYYFSLPSRALVSDFAVWDDTVRIPGVILERKQAEDIYNMLKAQAIDPGLLQMGERDASEARRGGVFSAKIVPIPAFGNKRVEIEYHERIPVENYQSQLAIPLHPDAYRAQPVAKLVINLEMVSQHALKSVEFPGKSYPFKVTQRGANSVNGTLEMTNISLDEDFVVRYALDPARADRLEILTHKDAGPAATPSPDNVVAPEPEAPEPGYFEAQALIATRPNATAQVAAMAGAPRTVVVLFDNSLSMQWEKIERNFEALEAILRGLTPRDRFNLLLFNSDVAAMAPAPIPAETAAVEKALEFVRASRLRGGTAFDRALAAGLKQPGANRYLVALSDGGSTAGTIANGKLAAWYSAQWNKMAIADRPRTYVFGVGDDANQPLLKMLARNDGVFEWVGSTEPTEFKLASFVSKIGRRPVDSLALKVDPAAAPEMVYPLEDTVFPGSVAAWVGQYKRTAAKASFSASGSREGQAFTLPASAALPAANARHPDLPRTWAKARVDALLEKIEREGEDRASVDEIIRLSRKYKFVTPYTSFLAAPRSLLRPRLIRPGDPLLRVKTDPLISSVTAVFPFGLVKKLRYLAAEDTWQTRFLAPVDLSDGTHRVELVLRDRQGHVYKESKTFVIASKPPVVRVKLDKPRYRRGETALLKVSASQTTRTVVARMYGAPPVRLRWNSDMASNTGYLQVPPNLAAGRYTLTVTAEDMAHNIGSQEVSLEVLP